MSYCKQTVPLTCLSLFSLKSFQPDPFGPPPFASLQINVFRLEIRRLPKHTLPHPPQLYRRLAQIDLALSLPPLLLVEGRQSSLLIRTVDLVFLSQTHSLHTAMSALLHWKRVSITVEIHTSETSTITLLQYESPHSHGEMWLCYS